VRPAHPSAAPTGGATPGLDLDALGAWFAAEIPGAGDRLDATMIHGGRSNLTYVVTDGAHEWIVRRPPPGDVLATAHDMTREYRVMSSLQDTAVPVPRTFALCTDRRVVGADFYVMEWCDGTPYRRAAELERLGPERTRAISERLVDTLAALHSVEPAAVGLADFGRPEGFLDRQVARWKRQLDASHTRDLPDADELHRRLARSVPAGSGAGIVHGDFRLDNVLIDDADRVRAVLDWELATLGDPLTDLALLLVYGRLSALVGDSGDLNDVVSDASSAPGFLDERGTIERYSRGSERNLSDVGFHIGLATFKLAAILEGVHHRYVRGQTVGAGFDRIGEVVPPLLRAGLDAWEEST
jgi:aminoglycoside phosphotransferase (APT) family kinase protein